MDTMRRVSSAQSSRASRRASGSFFVAAAISTAARVRVAGVRRSWATLSRASRMPLMRLLILSSMALNSRASSLSSSSAPSSGTRASMRPVSMARTVSMSPWMGLSVRRASRKPAVSPTRATRAMMPAKMIRN